MHELSIVQNIIKIVAIETQKSGVDKATEVNLEIGQLSGIEYNSLEFAFQNLSPGSVIEGAKINIEKPSGTALCKNCGNKFNIETFIGSCSLCNSIDIDIIRGKELRVKSITITKSK
jgi:hydrogenase nickel incorporation protein HypA/HybF